MPPFLSDIFVFIFVAPSCTESNSKRPEVGHTEQLYQKHFSQMSHIHTHTFLYIVYTNVFVVIYENIHIHIYKYP